MMRSMAASMASPCSSSDTFECFEFGDRLVGEPDLVAFTAVKHLHDDFQQPLVGDEAVGHRAGAAQIIRGDGVGIAHHPHIHHPHTALDQHGPILRFGRISPERGTGSIWDADSLINMKMRARSDPY